MADNDDIGPGFGRPPLRSRFQPGQSGNPRGRPKGARSFKSDLVEELSQTIAVRGEGGEVRITKQRAIVRKLVAASIGGDSKAALALINLCAKLLPDQEADPRAAEDEAFVDRLVERERNTETNAVSPRSPEDPEND